MAGDSDQGNDVIRGGQVGGRFVMSDDQFAALMARVTNEIQNASGAARALVAVTVPAFADHASYKRTVDGAVVRDITPDKWKYFLTDDICLRDEDINNLRDEGLEHPMHLTALTGDDVDAVIKNMKSKGTPLRAQSQDLLRNTCEWFCTLVTSNYTIKDTQFCIKMVFSHTVSFQPIQETENEKKGIPKGLPLLIEGAELLPWLKRSTRVLQRLVGINFFPLGYITRNKATVEQDDGGLILAGKRYTESTGSLRSFLVQRFTHDNNAFDTNN